MKIKSLIFQIFLILAGFVWVWISRVDPDATTPASIQAPQQGFLAPNFELETLSGSRVAIDDLRGKAVILNFWASWCPPCRAEMPAFQQALEENSDNDLAILGVNATNQDSLLDVENFLQEYRIGLTIPLDVNGQVSRLYQIHSLPTTFFINKQGIINKVIIGGPIPLSLLRIEIQQLLQENNNVPDN